MEKLTVTRIGEPKTINFTNKKTGQPDSFQKVGFQSNEYPDRWFDFGFRGTHNLVVGGTYDFELKSRDYNGKTYWDAQFPKSGGRGMPEADQARLKKAEENSYAALVQVQEMKRVVADILRNLTLSGVYKEYTSDGKPVPDFNPVAGAVTTQYGTANAASMVNDGSEPTLESFDNPAMQ